MYHASNSLGFIMGIYQAYLKLYLIRHLLKTSTFLWFSQTHTLEVCYSVSSDWHE